MIRQVKGLQSFLRPATRLQPQAFLYFPRRHYVQACLVHPFGEWFAPNRFAWTTTLEGWYGLLAHAGYPTALLCGPLSSLDKDHVVVVPFSEFLEEPEWADLESFAAKGGRVILQLPTEDPVSTKRVAAKLGLAVDEVEVRKGRVDGWVLTKGDGKNGGAAYEKRVTLSEANPLDVRARFHDNRRPALFSWGKDHWLVSAFDVGHSYNVTLRKELRGLIVSWIQPKLEPRIQVQGIDEDYRPLVEVNALQHDNRLLFICCNRSPYEWDMTVSVRGYAAGRIKVPPFESRQELVSGA
ncbi:MAG: DUF4350 domain-containing protein [Acidobacteria bacterium]|nr:DUF4350 domain-containing protein [Acidobacteriota bacterium]